MGYLGLIGSIGNGPYMRLRPHSKNDTQPTKCLATSRAKRIKINHSVRFWSMLPENCLELKILRLMHKSRYFEILEGSCISANDLYNTN